jgi:DUF971 family protein
MSVWPTELRLDKAKQTLTVTFDTGEHFALPAEYLRVESPSAEVQGHSPAEKQIVTGKEDVTITAIEPIGNYAVRLIFDDGHDSGLFSWDYLHTLGREMQTKWTAYLTSQGRRG